MQNFIHCENRMSLSDYCTVCLPHINTQTQVTFGFRNNNYRWNPRGCSLYLLNCIMGYQLIKLLFQLISYSATTRNRALGRSLSNHSDFWKQKILNFFDKGTNKIQGSTIQPLNFKTVWSNLTSQETALKSMNVWVRSPKILRIFCFHQSLQGLDNILPSALVRVVAA